jgi:hypothetical protein
MTNLPCRNVRVGRWSTALALHTIPCLRSSHLCLSYGSDIVHVYATLPGGSETRPLKKKFLLNRKTTISKAVFFFDSALLQTFGFLMIFFPNFTTLTVRSEKITTEVRNNSLFSFSMIN